MDEKVKKALATDRTIDITTTGRKSGQLRRIEIWFHNLDGRLYLTGSPGRRGWYANLRADPHFIFHLKRSVVTDIPARARPIDDPAERRQVLAGILAKLGGDHDLEAWVTGSPLVEIELLG